MNDKKSVNNTRSGLGITGLVLGILSLIFFWIPFLGFLISIAGIIVSSIAIKKASGKGMAIGGLITSIVAFLLSALVTFAVVGLIILGTQINSTEITDSSYYTLDKCLLSCDNYCDQFQIDKCKSGCNDAKDNRFILEALIRVIEKDTANLTC